MKEAEGKRNLQYFNEEVGIPLGADALAAAVVGPLAKAYRLVRWGLGTLSAARGVARLQKASEESGDLKTADTVAGIAEVVAGGLMFVPEIVKTSPKTTGHPPRAEPGAGAGSVRSDSRRNSP